ncbi:MAG TPA: hypothetical protein VGM26_18300, partial [Rhizomicrobium sp.]
GLDPQARRDLSQLLLSLKRDGMTLVVSSHILAELEDYSDRMIIVDHGRIAGGEAITLRDRLRLCIRLARAQEGLAAFLTGQGAGVVESDDVHAVVTLEGGDGARAALLAALVKEGFAVSEFAEDVQALEDAYFKRVRS